MSEGLGDGTRINAGSEVAAGRTAMAGGDLAAAATHLQKAAAADPALPALHEVLRDLAHLDPASATHALMPLTRLPDPASPEVTAQLAPMLDIARLAAEKQSDPKLLAALSGVARRLGAVDEAIEWCERAEEEAGEQEQAGSAPSGPDPSPAIMLGYALRRAGRLEDAHQAWLRALSRDPGNIDLHVDIAEELADQGRAAEAIGWLDKALAREPDHETAFPAAARMRFDRDGDARHLIALADWWRAHPGHDYADTMMARASHRRPWLNVVPGPAEVVCATVAQLAKQMPDAAALAQASAQVTLSALEVPSAVAAAAAAMPGLVITDVRSVPEPDIRRPLGDIRYRIWDYEQTRAVPNVAPPSAEAGAALTAEAGAGLWAHPLAAYDRAVRLSRLRLADLLGLLVYVPPAPDSPAWQEVQRSSPAYWPRYAQAWICLGLLHYQADEPWLSSTRRDVLTDLVRGAEDWSTDAAAFALVVAAWADPAVREDVAGLIAGRFLDAVIASQQRTVTIAESLAYLVLITPGMESAVSAMARDLIARGAQQPEQAPA